MINTGMMNCEYSYSSKAMSFIPLHNSCWIDTENGSIWAFVAPMLAIISVSSVVHSVSKITEIVSMQRLTSYF